LISESTATALRDYIIQQNTNIYRDDIIEVIENDFRYSFGIRVDEHPIIATALEEILLRRNPTLVSYLEAIMGPDPAVTEFTAISQEYGAVDQRWHHDGTLK
jgi:predicted nucleic-acid-binding protein